MTEPKPATATDRRRARTRLALRDAMLALLPARGWDDLNVQEICEQANVGRSTFYLHYRGKDDLLADGLNDLRAHLDAVALPGIQAAQPLAFMAGLLQHMVDQRPVFRAIIGKRSGHVIERRFRDMVLQLVRMISCSVATPDGSSRWQRGTSQGLWWM